MTHSQYAEALLKALEAEREQWGEPFYTHHVCLLNLIQNIIHAKPETHCKRCGCPDGHGDSLPGL